MADSVEVNVLFVVMSCKICALTIDKTYS